MDFAHNILRCPVKMSIFAQSNEGGVFGDFYASVGSWLPFNSHENWWFDHQLLGAFYCV
jgi:hypothetical protein